MFGFKALGHNNRPLLFGDGSTLAFRGKASFVAGSAFYPADAPGNQNHFRVWFRTTSWDTYHTFNSSNLHEARVVQVGTATGTTNTVMVSGRQQKNIGVFTYRIVCHNTPVVFFHTTNHLTKGTLLSIIQNGTSNGASVWDLKVMVTFPLGEAESVFLPRLTLYCFSEFHVSDLQGHGIAIYRSNGSVAYSSSIKVLEIENYVQIASSHIPNTLSNITYNLSFSPDAKQNIFSMSKPGFMNIDFARYKFAEFVPFGLYWTVPVAYLGFWDGRHHGYSFHIFSDSEVINGGFAVNGSNLDFSLSVIDVNFSFRNIAYTHDTAHSPPPPSITYILDYKREIFPTVIPVIDCTLYD